MEDLQNQEVRPSQESQLVSQPVKKPGIPTFIGIAIIVVVAVILFGGVFAYQYYSKNQSQPVRQILNAKIESGLANIFRITWASSGVDKVNIELFNPDGSKNRVIASSLDNKNQYEWAIDDLAAWRSWDGPFKVVISDASNSAVKTEIDNFTASGSYPADNYSDDQTVDWKTYTNTEYGFSLSYPEGTKITSNNPQYGGSEFVYEIPNSNKSVRVDLSLVDILRGAPVPDACDTKANQANINGAVFYIGDTSAAYSGAAEISFATEYCAIKNNLHYKITIILSGYNNGSEHVNPSSDFVLAKMLNSFKITQTQGEKENTPPKISSITPTSAKIGNTIEITGDRFAGFEGDLHLWIENSAGVKGIIYGDRNSSNDNLIRFTLPASVCQTDNSYSGLPCSATMQLITGSYKIFVKPLNIESNKIDFQIK